MTDKGAITQAIEALEWVTINLDMTHVDTAAYIDAAREKAEQALEALKAFKAGVPEGLEYAQQVTNGLSGQMLSDAGREQLTTREMDTIYTSLKAAKHFHEAVK